MDAISIKTTIGVGDAVQFTSVPENYFRTFGKKLIDLTNHWVLDHNPYVVRNSDVKPLKTFEMWDFKPRKEPRGDVYLSLAERHAFFVGANVFLKHPRLYQFEDTPFQARKKIILHTQGVSHGAMPKHVIEHVLQKYGPTGDLCYIGLQEDPSLRIPRLVAPTLWDLVREISSARMLIGVDSGPSWIAMCYPDIVVKKVRTKPTLDVLKDWIPMQISNIHSHWDDRSAQTFNTSEDDVGFTSSYKKL